MALDDRLRCAALRDRIKTADEAAGLIDDGMCVAVSGFTPSGCPKAVPLALAAQVRAGRQVKLTLLSGASTGEEIDSAWASLGIIARRMPYMTSKPLRAAVNGVAEQEIAYADGRRDTVVTDASWDWSDDGPIREADNKLRMMRLEDQ